MYVYVSVSEQRTIQFQIIITGFRRMNLCEASKMIWEINKLEMITEK